ncbi:hypothetical protein [Agriterribacter sp.]|uniref:hypothetical protein n=1 Tax=Agriterribacter sp. TaxID=2821509 RepID=UPI002C88091A|nr:hypothetical protein [Agriterribacter sp.]HRO45421.1 hypothetical protein [Agriterribacter sp.]HRQ16888.1 hypothetical protein [Agriterribacter sp.]
MKGMKRKIVLALAIMTGTVIGTFRGETAKQRFITKVKDKYEDHNKIRQQEIMLDEFELSAFHTS